MLVIYTWLLISKCSFDVYIKCKFIKKMITILFTKDETKICSQVEVESDCHLFLLFQVYFLKKTWCSLYLKYQIHF